MKGWLADLRQIRCPDVHTLPTNYVNHRTFTLLTNSITVRSGLKSSIPISVRQSGGGQERAFAFGKELLSCEEIAGAFRN
jgi:hypothetical protein